MASSSGRGLMTLSTMYESETISRLLTQLGEQSFSQELAHLHREDEGLVDFATATRRGGTKEQTAVATLATAETKSCVGNHYVIWRTGSALNMSFEFKIKPICGWGLQDQKDVNVKKHNSVRFRILTYFSHERKVSPTHKYRKCLWVQRGSADQASSSSSSSPSSVHTLFFYTGKNDLVEAPSTPPITSSVPSTPPQFDEKDLSPVEQYLLRRLHEQSQTIEDLQTTIRLMESDIDTLKRLTDPLRAHYLAKGTMISPLRTDSTRKRSHPHNSQYSQGDHDESAAMSAAYHSDPFSASSSTDAIRSPPPQKTSPEIPSSFQMVPNLQNQFVADHYVDTPAENYLDPFALPEFDKDLDLLFADSEPFRPVYDDAPLSACPSSPDYSMLAPKRLRHGDVAYAFCACIPEEFKDSLLGRCVSLVPRRIDGNYRLVLELGMAPNAVAPYIVTSTRQCFTGLIGNEHGVLSELPTTDAPAGHCWQRVLVAMYGGTVLARVVNAQELVHANQPYFVVPCTGEDHGSKQGLFRVSSSANASTSAVGAVWHYPVPQTEIAEQVDSANAESTPETWRYVVAVAFSPKHLQAQVGTDEQQAAVVAEPPVESVDNVPATDPAPAPKINQTDKQVHDFEKILLSQLHQSADGPEVDQLAEAILSSSLNSTFQRLATLVEAQTDPEIVALLQQCKHDGDFLDVKNKRGRTLLFLAVQAGEEALVALFCQIPSVRATIIDVADSAGRTPFHVAAEKGNLEMIRLLIQSGSKALDSCDTSHKTAMHYAALNGHVQVVEALVQLGTTQIDSVDSDGYTPLHLAAKEGHAHVIETLCRLGSKAVDTESRLTLMPMHSAARYGHIAVIEALIRLGSQTLDYSNRYGRTPMHEAARNRQVLVIKALLRLGSRAIDAPARKGGRPLHFAANYGFVDVIEALVKADCQIDVQDYSGWTPLHTAAADGRLEVIEALLRLGSSALSMLNNEGMTPIALAECKDDSAAVRILSQAINVLTNGVTPFHQAVADGCLEVVKELARFNRQAIHTADRNGFTALHYAVSRGHIELLKELVQLGSRINTPDNYGNTPMHVAAQFGHCDAVRELVELGSQNFDTTNNAGQTPIAVAEQCEQHATAQTLRHLKSKQAPLAVIARIFNLPFAKR